MKKTIAIIGGGAIGSITAWHLAKFGHEITLIDPELDNPINYSGNRSASLAALGVLMGNVFRRSSGRAWRLRQCSMDLWPKWIKELSTREYQIKIERPLIQIASSNSEVSLMKKIAESRKESGLMYYQSNSELFLNEIWPSMKYGGLISYNDGRIDCIKLHHSLKEQLKRESVQLINQKVLSLKRINSQSLRWEIELQEKSKIKTEIVIICSALGSESLLNGIGYSRPLLPVLGQVIVVKLIQKIFDNWPAVISVNGINIIPQENNEVIIGATLEKGINPNLNLLEKLQSIEGEAPSWLTKAKIINNWYGIRARPEGRNSPLLEKLESNLILATGHYRNGILLAPATAEWILKNIS